MKAFPIGKYVDGPDALKGARAVLVVDISASRDNYVEKVENMARDSTDLGEIMGDSATRRRTSGKF